MGAESMNRAWSTYGGRWHEVRVRYRHWRHWGTHPGSALLERLLLAGVGGFALWLVGTVLVDRIDEARGIELLVSAAILAVPAAIAVLGIVLAGRAALDLASSGQITGEIVRLRVTRGEGGEALRHYVAVDDCSGKTIRAWSVRPQLYAGLQQGQLVTARVTPRLRYVHSIEPAPSAAPRSTEMGAARPGTSLPATSQPLVSAQDHAPPRSERPSAASSTGREKR
jgi:hypothetical protein